MPTQEELYRHVENFERLYPEKLGERLEWWVATLGIAYPRFLQLLGLSRAEAIKTPRSALRRIVRSHKRQAELADEMLLRLLASFDYDLDSLSAAILSPLEGALKKKRQSNRRSRSVATLPSVLDRESPVEVLINEMILGGPASLPGLLLGYLYDPEHQSNGELSPRE